MNAADTVNIMGTILKTLQQDPLSFMVVYPMALMTTSVLLYALLQDLIPAFNASFAHAPKVASQPAFKSTRKTEKTPRFLN